MAVIEDGDLIGQLLSASSKEEKKGGGQRVGMEG